MTNSKSILFLLAVVVAVLLLAVATGTTREVAASFSPHQGDYFKYSEVENLGNGTGSYQGYTEHTTVSGMETMNGIANNIVSTSYSCSYDYTNNEGNSTTASQSGNFTWSSANFLYVNGTDNQVGYVNPTVWFAMNPSLSDGSTFYLLNTQMTILSKNYSYYLQTENKYVETIFAQGISSYYGSPDDNAYGFFNATYTWKAYFDPSTGYIVGYNYVEHDSNSSAGFSYTDNLYVTSTSYPLSTAVAPLSTTTSSTSNSSFLGQYLTYIIVAVVLAIIIVVVAIVVLVSRRRKPPIPMHPEPHYTPPPPPTQPPSPPDIHLTQSEPSQVVMRETVTINCKFCGTAYDIRRATCPQCGAPRT